MAKKMLIDATHAEETRVVVVEGNKVEEFDFESENRRQLAGNIYLAKVTRIEPSLQAAFIDYGGNRHGFLAFSEIHPDYYQIPVADREALMAEERAYSEAMRKKDDDEESSETVENDISGGEERRLNPEKPETLKDEVNDEDERQNSGDERNEKKSSKSKLKPTDKKRKSIVKSNENNQKKAVYKTNYPTNGVNFGVGMNWIFYNGLSSGLYLVRIISEEPSFTYELEEDWECSSSCRSNYESTVKKYTPNNSFYLTFGYNF